MQRKEELIVPMKEMKIELGAIHPSRCVQVSTFSYTPVYQPVLLYLDGLHLLGTKCALASCMNE
jgi:hypothetical protein